MLSASFGISTKAVHGYSIGKTLLFKLWCFAYLPFRDVLNYDLHNYVPKMFCIVTLFCEEFPVTLVCTRSCLSWESGVGLSSYNDWLTLPLPTHLMTWLTDFATSYPPNHPGFKIPSFLSNKVENNIHWKVLKILKINLLLSKCLNTKENA